MAGYEFIRGEIVKDPAGDGGGAKGPKGSFNHTGGMHLVISYTTPTGPEEHHIVPYLIGKSRTKDVDDDDDASVRVLLAWKYATNSTTHPGLGFRCYKVDQITLPGTAPTVPRPALGTGASDRKKLKLKRQSCVDVW